MTCLSWNGTHAWAGFFIGRQPDSIEAKKQYARLLAKMAARLQPADMREYLMADYPVLNAFIDATRDRLANIYLVLVKHHKQSSLRPHLEE
jgi:hypothetical protein